MAFFRHYQCPVCDGVFKFLHVLSDSPPPDACELCHASMIDDSEPVFVPQAPRIGTYKGNTPDQLYRQMEQASADRTEDMAALGGGSASDYAYTKITDMADTVHEGESSAKYSPSQDYVQEFMRLNQPVQGGPVAGGPAPAVGMVGSAGAEYARAAHTGAFAHAGLAIKDRVGASHASMARAVEQQGRINKK